MAVSETLFVFILGMVFGSFGNVLISRVPKGESIITPGSHCPKCLTPIKVYHNIPLFSWLWLRGRCAACGEKISPIYPLVELGTGVIFLSVYWKVGISLFALDAALAFFLLFVLSMIDLEHKAVPDHINLPAFFIALLASPFFLHNLENALLIAGGMAMLRFAVSWALRKEAMGEADIIVGGTMGALLGVEQTLMAIFAASLISLPFALVGRFRGEEPEIPFIPFLALGSWLVYLFGSYVPLFRGI